MSQTATRHTDQATVTWTWSQTCPHCPNVASPQVCRAEWATWSVTWSYWTAQKWYFFYIWIHILFINKGRLTRRGRLFQVSLLRPLDQNLKISFSTFWLVEQKCRLLKLIKWLKKGYLKQCVPLGECPFVHENDTASVMYLEISYHIVYNILLYVYLLPVARLSIYKIFYLMQTHPNFSIVHKLM